MWSFSSFDVYDGIARSRHASPSSEEPCIAYLIHILQLEQRKRPRFIDHVVFNFLLRMSIAKSKDGTGRVKR